MKKIKSTMNFRIMSLMFKIRDLIEPRINILREAGIEKGFRVLDYGCGPGGYIFPVAELVGPSGQIYALDVHPLALKKIQAMTATKGLANVKTIQSDCATGLPDDFLDVALMYDVFHDLAQPEDILTELHRILKKQGMLSFSDHHMKEPEIVSRLTRRNLFKFERKGKKTYLFRKYTDQEKASG